MTNLELLIDLQPTFQTRKINLLLSFKADIVFIYYHFYLGTISSIVCDEIKFYLACTTLNIVNIDMTVHVALSCNLTLTI